MSTPFSNFLKEILCGFRGKQKDHGETPWSSDKGGTDIRGNAGFNVFCEVTFIMPSFIHDYTFCFYFKKTAQHFFAALFIILNFCFI